MAIVSHPNTQLSKHIFCRWTTLNPQSKSPSILRTYSSQRSKHTDNADDAAADSQEGIKSKLSSTKTKTAIALARLINGTSKPWSPDLEISLSSLASASSLSKTTVIQVLNLIRTPYKALRFFDWVQLIGFTHDELSFFLILEILGRNGNLNAARNFLFSIERRSNGSVKLQDKYFNSLIRSYGRAGLFQESIKIFKTMKSMGVSPSVITFNSLFSILLKRGRTRMVYDLYDEMLKTYGVTPDTYTFNILIKGFCMNSMVEEGFRFFKEMDSFRCEPDVVTYNTLVDGLCRKGKVKTAHNIVKGMLRKDLNFNPNVVTYTTLIKGYCAKQEINEALDVLNDMLEKALKPNEISYNTLIQGLCVAKKLDKIKEIFQIAVGGGDFVPDTCTFNTLMNAHCSAGNIEEAMEVFEKMSEMKVPSDSATYGVLIRSLCQRGDFEKAEELFDELSVKEILLVDVGCTPLVAAYNPIFVYLCANGKTKKAEKVFRQLMTRGIQDPNAYKTLIMGHCKEGSFDAGHDLLVLMLRDFVPDIETYESLIYGLLQKDEPKLAKDTVDRMLKSSFLPKTSIFHSTLKELVRKGCARESASLLLLMLDKKVRPNVNLSTDIVRLQLQSGLKNKANEILKCLYESCYVVKMDELIGFLCNNRKLLEARELLLFSLEKDQSVHSDICSTVLNGLCKIHRVSEAFGLYYELLEKGVQQPLHNLENLRTALEAEGKSKEAEFVSKRMQTASYG